MLQFSPTASTTLLGTGALEGKAINCGRYSTLPSVSMTSVWSSTGRHAQLVRVDLAVADRVGILHVAVEPGEVAAGLGVQLALEAHTRSPPPSGANRRSTGHPRAGGRSRTGHRPPTSQEVATPGMMFVVLIEHDQALPQHHRATGLGRLVEAPGHIHVLAFLTGQASEPAAPAERRPTASPCPRR